MAETEIFLELGLVMSGLRSQLRGVANRVLVQRGDVSDFGMLSCWQLDTLITCVGFLRHDVSDLEMLSSEVNWVIVKFLSSATPPRPDFTTILQGRGISWRKWSNLVSCVGVQKLDGSYLEGLVLAETKIFWEVTLERERSDTGNA